MTGERGNDPAFQRALGRNIAAARRRAGLTQVRVGAALGVAYSLVAFWETGQRAMYAETLTELARLYQVDPAVLIPPVTKPADQYAIQS